MCASNSGLPWFKNSSGDCAHTAEHHNRTKSFFMVARILSQYDKPMKLALTQVIWGGWWGLNPRLPEPQSGATTN